MGWLPKPSGFAGCLTALHETAAPADRIGVRCCCVGMHQGQQDFGLNLLWRLNDLVQQDPSLKTGKGLLEAARAGCSALGAP